MTDRRCERCLFYDICTEKDYCENFCDWESDDEVIGGVIEDGRQVYFKEWYVYVDEEHDDVGSREKPQYKVVQVFI